MRWNGASCCEFDGKSMETETTTWSEFPNGGKAIVEQILVSEEINKSKIAGAWDPVSGIQVGKLTTGLGMPHYHPHKSRKRRYGQAMKDPS